MKYLHLFKTQSAHTEAYKRGGGYVEPWVDFVKETDEVHYNLPPIDWKTQYLTFKALEDGTFKFSGNSVSYSTDFGKTWTTLSANANSPTVKKDKYIMWKGELTPTSSIGVGSFSSTGNYEVMGNPYSLLYGDAFESKTSLTNKNYALYNLFLNSISLTSAENLSLPATTLATYCYQSMFDGCTLLTTAPELSATTLAANCYNKMFRNCTSLTTAPELPATTLAGSCYASMFKGCTSLTTAPSVLPATILNGSCYSSMFNGCVSLTTAPVLSATRLYSYCYDNMFNGCTSLNYIKAMFTTTPSSYYTNNWVNGVASTGTFVKNSAATWNVTGANGIPTGWTVQTASA